MEGEDILKLLKAEEGVVNSDIRAFGKIIKQIPHIGQCLLLKGLVSKETVVPSECAGEGLTLETSSS